MNCLVSSSEHGGDMKKNNKPIPALILLALLLLIPVFSIGSDSSHQLNFKGSEGSYQKKFQETEIPEFFVPPPPFSEGIFPCNECHGDMEVNKERRVLEDFHSEIKLIHAGSRQWCLDCHNPDDRDKLRLIDGSTITFEKSYYLCGQCHGTIFRDWKSGVHGKRTGEWNGKKLYRLCVQCHNPHQPRFKPLKPKPPPVKPSDIK